MLQRRRFSNFILLLRLADTVSHASGSLFIEEEAKAVMRQNHCTTHPGLCKDPMMQGSGELSTLIEWWVGGKLKRHGLGVQSIFRQLHSPRYTEEPKSISQGVAFLFAYGIK